MQNCEDKICLVDCRLDYLACLMQDRKMLRSSYLLNRTCAPINDIVSLQAVDNGKWVCAENAGTAPLMANRDSPGPWESFSVVDISNVYGASAVGLLAHANEMFVCAESEGTAPLIANRETAELWEAFIWIINSDGTVSLQAQVNELRICLDLVSGTLLANQTIPGVSAKFNLKVW